VYASLRLQGSTSELYIVRIHPSADWLEKLNCS